ncbi:MAG: hypothetical protein ACP5SB_05530 [Caldisericaceae bacterium]
MQNMPFQTPYLYPTDISAIYQKLSAALSALPKILGLLFVAAVPVAFIVLILILLFKINNRLNSIYWILSQHTNDKDTVKKAKTLEGVFENEEKDKEVKK